MVIFRCLKTFLIGQEIKKKQTNKTKQTKKQTNKTKWIKTKNQNNNNNNNKPNKQTNKHIY